MEKKIKKEIKNPSREHRSIRDIFFGASRSLLCVRFRRECARGSEDFDARRIVIIG